jgi:protein subunit release factor B
MLCRLPVIHQLLRPYLACTPLHGLLLCRGLSGFPLPGGEAPLIAIPRDRISATFSRSSGAGGQNVNKVSTKAEVRFVLAAATWMPEEVRGRFAELYPGHINSEGEVYVTSQKHRTQESNLEDAMDKLGHMVRKAAAVPKVRQLRTNLSELTKNAYREDKKHRAEVKSHRRPPRDPFD